MTSEAGDSGPRDGGRPEDASRLRDGGEAEAVARGSGEKGRAAGAGYGGGVGTRREAREQALSLLYEAEAKNVEPAAVIDDLPLAPDRFTEVLVRGVGEHRTEIDELIRAHARGWKLERMPAVDRAVLRLGVYELLHQPEVPTATVICEAVELAKRFSTEESGRFVNGMLGAIAQSTRP